MTRTLPTARSQGMETIGLISEKDEKIKQISHCTIIVPSEETSDVQEYHLPIYYIMYSMLEAKFFKNDLKCKQSFMKGSCKKRLSFGPFFFYYHKNIDSIRSKKLYIIKKKRT